MEKRTETRDQAINRLAIEAKKRGIQIFSYPRTNEFYATSASNPETLHRVTVLSCDCAGYFAHGRCTHHSALLDHIGELPELDPDPVADARAELSRLESLWQANRLKSCDIRGLQNARPRFAELTNPVPLAIAS